MKQLVCTAFAVVILWLPQRAAVPSDGREIDGPHSTITLRVFKSGFLSAFGHDHEIQAPIQSGQVKESGDLSVELRIDARKLRVLDPDASDSTRVQIQKTMEGPQVLDAERYSEIHFRSTGVEPKGSDHWLVTGNLELHGQMHQVTVEVTFKDGIYKGSGTLKQTAFGIIPVAIAGGTVKVKDDVKLEFEIALAK